MPSRSTPFRFTRKLVIATLMGAIFLASPLTGARADPAAAQEAATAQANAANDKGETVEQRITNLHAALKITDAEESKWNDVAQAMRENTAAMEKLVAEKHRQAPQNMTALEDLMTYREFAQAHLDGLKNLTAAFKTLYEAMPDAGKLNADKVFQSFGHEATSSHS